MLQPGQSTVTIDGNNFDALNAEVGLHTHHDGHGMPMMAAQAVSIHVTVDIHDTVNMPFPTLIKLFDLANNLTTDKICDMKIEYWKDEHKQDAICVYQFRGWIANFVTSSGAGSNHILHLSLQPALGAQHYTDLKMSN